MQFDEHIRASSTHHVLAVSAHWRQLANSIERWADSAEMFWRYAVSWTHSFTWKAKYVTFAALLFCTFLPNYFGVACYYHRRHRRNFSINFNINACCPTHPYASVGDYTCCICAGVRVCESCVLLSLSSWLTVVEFHVIWEVCLLYTTSFTPFIFSE